jgi:hypothetical protein
VILWALSWQRGCSSSHEKKGFKVRRRAITKKALTYIYLSFYLASYHSTIRYPHAHKAAHELAWIHDKCDPRHMVGGTN